MIGVVTDSASNIPPEMVEEFGIEVVPLNVHIEDESYEDGKFDIRMMYEKMRAGILPRTSQPAPGKFVDVYKKLASRVSSIISIHLTSKHSGTFQSALLARSMVPDIDVEVVDSRLISMGTGFIVLAAAQAARLGKGKEEILNLIKNLRERVHTYATVSTLHYLHMGGRVSAIKSLMASLLNVKPILTVREGAVVLMGQARTRRKSLERLVSLTYEAMKNFASVDLAVLHADALEEARQLKEALEGLLNYRSLYVLEVTPVLAVHGGPGLIGIVSIPCVEI